MKLFNVTDPSTYIYNPNNTFYINVSEENGIKTFYINIENKSMHNPENILILEISAEDGFILDVFANRHSHIDMSNHSGKYSKKYTLEEFEDMCTVNYTVGSFYINYDTISRILMYIYNEIKEKEPDKLNNLKEDEKIYLRLDLLRE